jgi:hypothetical protein
MSRQTRQILPMPLCDIGLAPPGSLGHERAWCPPVQIPMRSARLLYTARFHVVKCTPIRIVKLKNRPLIPDAHDFNHLSRALV